MHHVDQTLLAQRITTRCSRRYSPVEVPVNETHPAVTLPLSLEEAIRAPRKRDNQLLSTLARV